MFQSLLFAVYSEFFPLFVPEEAPRSYHEQPERTHSAIDAILDFHPAVARLAARIRMDWWMPVAHPIQWWRHMIAVNKLLDDLGLSDL